LIRRNPTTIEDAKELFKRVTCKSLTGENGDLFLRRKNAWGQLAREKKGRSGRAFIVSALRGRSGI
jgi:hypothetical protein